MSGRRASNEQTVLYIADLWQLLPEDAKRKGRSTPLEWGKFRSPSDAGGDGLRYQLRRGAIKARAGGFAVLGIYDELLSNYGFNRIAPLRGWIVNHDYRAATPGQIGQVIGCRDVRLIGRALRALEAVGLLMRTAAPDWPEAIRRDVTIRVGQALSPPRPPQKETTTPPTTPQATTAPNGQEPTTGEGDVAGEAADGGDEKRPLSGQRPDGGRTTAGRRPDDGRTRAVGRETKETENEQTGDGRPATGDDETRDGETLAPATAAPQSLSAAGNGRQEKNGDGSARLDGGQDKETQTGDGQPTERGQAETEDRRPALQTGQADRRAEPAEPTEADPCPAGIAGDGGPFNIPSAWPDSADVIACEVARLLYPSREDLVLQGRKCRPPQGAEEFERRELGAIRVAMAGVATVLSQIELLAFRDRAMKMATATTRKRTRRPRGAVFLYWLNAHMRAAVGATRWEAARRTAKGTVGMAAGPP